MSELVRRSANHLLPSISRVCRESSPSHGRFRMKPGAAQDAMTEELISILCDGQSHKAGELAFRFGVNSKTIRRKLHFLRDELGLPIEPGSKGFQLRPLAGNE